MTRHFLAQTVGAGLLACSLMPVAIGHTASDPSAAKPDKKQAGGKVLENETRLQAEGAISQQRKQIIEEAMSAVTETKNALQALEGKKTQDALAALERATGKLNIILAREPKLEFAPAAVDVMVHDVYTTGDEIKKARKEAEQYLKDGSMQKARMALRDLASEINISVAGLPLKSYPAAIADVTPLIDQGKTEEAKLALEAALNTFVIVDHIIALPILSADMKLERAAELAKKEKRSEEDNKHLAKLLDEAREQLKFAEALGYGSNKDHKIFYSEIAAIEANTKNGKSGKDYRRAPLQGA
jgi:hypothetical protein